MYISIQQEAASTCVSLRDYKIFHFQFYFEIYNFLLLTDSILSSRQAFNQVQIWVQLKPNLTNRFFLKNGYFS